MPRSDSPASWRLFLSPPPPFSPTSDYRSHRIARGFIVRLCGDYVTKRGTECSARKSRTIISREFEGLYSISLSLDFSRSFDFIPRCKGPFTSLASDARDGARCAQTYLERCQRRTEKREGGRAPAVCAAVNLSLGTRARATSRTESRESEREEEACPSATRVRFGRGRRNDLSPLGRGPQESSSDTRTTATLRGHGQSARRNVAGANGEGHASIAAARARSSSRARLAAARRLARGIPRRTPTRGGWRAIEDLAAIGSLGRNDISPVTSG